LIYAAAPDSIRVLVTVPTVVSDPSCTVTFKGDPNFPSGTATSFYDCGGTMNNICSSTKFSYAAPFGMRSSWSGIVKISSSKYKFSPDSVMLRPWSSGQGSIRFTGAFITSVLPQVKNIRVNQKQASYFYDLQGRQIAGKKFSGPYIQVNGMYKKLQFLFE
jgi:hypothetical protein